MQAIKKSELTMAIFSDFYKAYDTIDHSRILEKMHKMDFPKLFLTLDSAIHS